MNHCYRSIRNDKTGTCVAVSEVAELRGKKKSSSAFRTPRARAHFAVEALAASLMMCFAVCATPGPVGGVVAAGSAGIAGGASTDHHHADHQQRGDQLAELRHRAGQSRAVPPARQQFGGAQPGAGPRSVPHLRQPFGQRQGLPGQSERRPVRQRRVGQRRRPGGLHPEYFRRQLHGGRATASPTRHRARSSTRATINADGGYVALLGANVGNQGVISARLGTVALAAGNADHAGRGRRRTCSMSQWTRARSTPWCKTAA